MNRYRTVATIMMLVISVSDSTISRAFVVQQSKMSANSTSAGNTGAAQLAETGASVKEIPWMALVVSLAKGTPSHDLANQLKQAAICSQDDNPLFREISEEYVLALGGTAELIHAIRKARNLSVCDAELEKNQTANAQNDMRNLCATSPSKGVYHLVFGLTLLSGTDMAAPITEFRRAVSLSPELAAAHFFLSAVLNGTGAEQEGMAQLREAIRLKPNNFALYLFLAGILNKKGDTNGSMAAIQEAIRIAPQSGAPHGVLGSIYMENKNYQAAISEARMAIQLEPDDPYNHSFLGKVYYSKGDYANAVPEFREFLRLSPSAASFIHSWLAQSLYQIGQYDGAISEAKMVLIAHPDSADMKKLIGDAENKISHVSGNKNEP